MKLKLKTRFRACVTKMTAWLLGVKMPRPVQRAGYDRLRHKSRRLLVAPQGCGKTLLTKTIALEETLFDGMHVLIAVPQRNIGVQYGGSSGERLWLPCKAWTGPASAAAAAVIVTISAATACLLGVLAVVPLWWLWRRTATRPWIAVNKCEDTDESVNEVEAFILGGEGIMVCCTASLARAWARIGDVSAVQGLSLWIDESHYVKASDERSSRNRVGEMVNAMVHGMSVRVSLVTATPFRGDGEDMIHRDDISKFTKFEYPWDMHFKENMPSVENVKFDYLWYSSDEERGRKLAEWIGVVGPRALVYIPHPRSMLSSQSHDGKPNKIVDLDRVKAAIESVDPGAEVIDLVTDRANGGDNSAEMTALQGRIAEVVSRSEEGRWRRHWVGLVGWFRPEDARHAVSDPPYVVALNLMKVGSDWPNLRSIADLAPSESRTDGAQKFGRLSREPTRGVDKRTISYAFFFPALGRRPDEEMRVACSGRLTSLISALLLEYTVSVPLFERRGRGCRRGESESEITIPDHDRIEEEFLARLANMEGGCEHETCQGVARRLMEEMGIPLEMHGRLMRLVQWVNRRPTDATAESLVQIGLFDEVDYGELGALMILTTGDRGQEIFEKYRRVSRSRFKEPFTHEMVERCALAYKKKHGKVPASISGTECLPDGWTWIAINGRVDGLLRFLTEKGIAKEEFSEEMVERCALAYKKKHGKPPGNKSGAECLPGGWTWCAIDQKLKNGLLIFLTEKVIAKEEFSEEMAERCARVYKEKYGKLPTSDSGTECLSEGWTWNAIDQRFKKELGSLPSFLLERSISEAKAEYSDEMAERCALVYKKKHGRWPTQKSGVDCLPPGWRWSAISRRVGPGGLRGFLEGRGIMPSPPTEKQAIEAILARMDSEPGWRPSTRDATQILGLRSGVSCKSLSAAISKHRYGFDRENDTFTKMLRRHGIG